MHFLTKECWAFQPTCVPNMTDPTPSSVRAFKGPISEPKNPKKLPCLSQMSDGILMEEGEGNRETEVAPALLAVHPFDKFVAVSVGAELRIFDLQGGYSVLVKDDSAGLHKDSIRAIRFSAHGKLLVSAGDDKLVKIWTTDSWCCTTTVYSEKRVSAVAITNDSHFVCFADKFGVVWVVDLTDYSENQALVNKKAVPILAHYCSIITTLEFSPDGRFLISADRDSKIRVTVFPKKPLVGAHEIQRFCLGHTEFVSCLAFVSIPDCHEALLVSGSGDSTVRLWDVTDGTLLDTCEVGTEAGLLQSNVVREEESHPAVTDLCTIDGGNIVAVAIQSLQGIVLLSCNVSARTFAVAKVVPIKEEMFVPTCLWSSRFTNLLWMIMGVSNLSSCDLSSLARVKVITGLGESNLNSVDLEPKVLEDEAVPGGVKLLETLQGSLVVEAKVFSAAAEAVKTAMRSLLIKKQYPTEKREFRKRSRNDLKFKQ